MRARHMVRSFAADPVAPASLDRLLAAALGGPSAGNAQGLHMVVLTDDECGRYWDITLPEPARPDFPWPGLLVAPGVPPQQEADAAYDDHDEDEEEPSSPTRSSGCGRGARYRFGDLFYGSGNLTGELLERSQVVALRECVEGLVDGRSNGLIVEKQRRRPDFTGRDHDDRSIELQLQQFPCKQIVPAGWVRTEHNEVQISFDGVRLLNEVLEIIDGHRRTGFGDVVAELQFRDDVLRFGRGGGQRSKEDQEKQQGWDESVHHLWEDS